MMAQTGEAMKPGQTAPPEQKSWGRFHILTISGIKINVDYSWIIIFVLVLWGISAGYFPHFFPGYTTQLYWIAGFIATMLFFASILIHELAHSLVALRMGIQIPDITLFIFGGISRLSEEPSDPRAELKIAIAGPLMSFALAAIFWFIKVLIQGETPSLIVAIFHYLAWINVALGVFNLVPGFPLDGGRVLRAILWWRTGSLEGATKWASDIGKGFAWALMILGAFEIFAGHLIAGIWLVFIGMFLRGIASAGYQEVMMKQSLEGVRVKEVMVENVVTVDPDMHLEDLSEKFFFKHGHGGYPVVQDHRALGLVSLAQVKDIPSEERGWKTVRDVMVPINEQIEIGPEDSLVDALKKMSDTRSGRLLVMDRDRMAGMITKTGLMRFLEMKRVLHR
ncbi:MAG: site-2 protease family protein [Deltaproteobacteria bacterium]